MKNNITGAAFVRGLIGIAVGAVGGYFAYVWLLQYGLYALAVPGALMGLACGFLSKCYSPKLGFIAALAAVPVSIYCEWTQFPFTQDGSLGYFVSNLAQLKGGTWIMGLVGVFFSFWFGLGHPPEKVGLR
ncbi:MAG: hypothetical protein KF752_04690 [Pirellulaceae bacterium]|nr:hypothetical protein [Pirellulaceae bacterium]